MKKRSWLLCLLLLPMVCIGYLFYQHYSTQDGLCIVGYHGVVSDEEKETIYANNRYFLSQSQFQRQMQYLYDNHYQTLSMQDIEDYYNGKKEIGKKAIALTFDDGYKNFNTIVKPILKEYGFQGTCFVIGKNLNNKSPLTLKKADLHNDENVQYYSHSYNLHRKTKGFDRKIIQDLSLEDIAKDFAMNSVDHTYFAFPYGRTRQDIEPLLKDNHVKLAFSYNQFRHMTRKDNRYELPRYMIVDVMPDFYFHWIAQ